MTKIEECIHIRLVSIINYNRIWQIVKLPLKDWEAIRSPRKMSVWRKGAHLIKTFLGTTCTVGAEHGGVVLIPLPRYPKFQSENHASNRGKTAVGAILASIRGE